MLDAGIVDVLGTILGLGDFEALRKSEPGSFKDRLALSWSNWGFGMESLDDSAARLGEAFAQAVNAQVKAGGVNSVTRKTLFTQLNAIHQFDANGMLAPIDLAGRKVSKCSVTMQVKGGKFVRSFTCDAATEAEVIRVAVASLLSQSPVSHPSLTPDRSLAVALATGSPGASSAADAPLANVQGVS